MAKKKTLSTLNFDLKKISPLTETQDVVLNSDNNMVLQGCPGTGKSFLAMYIALKDVLDDIYYKVVIVRSAVPTRDIGFLPGGLKEKTEVYEQPYKEIASELFGRGDAYEILKQKGIVEFTTTSFIRGITLQDSVIIVDEFENMTFQELDSIITRVGDNCRIMFCGDLLQSDLPRNGLKQFTSILKNMKEFDLIEFEPEDIVRSGLVKSYILEKFKTL